VFEVVQVIPQSNFTVIVYFDDGKIVIYDMKPLIEKGNYEKISKSNEFIDKCVVLNGTLAWDVEGKMNEKNCIIMDVNEVYNNGTLVEEPID